MQTLEEAQEESGWKLVHGDVFRAPETSPMLFSVLAGTGVQIFAMTLVAMVFAILGFLSPANRGGLLTGTPTCTDVDFCFIIYVIGPNFVFILFSFIFCSYFALVRIYGFVCRILRSSPL
jgi:hypothetical protein